jgi:hypothetical protein
MQPSGKLRKTALNKDFHGGEGGIRTQGSLASTAVFKTSQVRVTTYFRVSLHSQKPLIYKGLWDVFDPFVFRRVGTFFDV